MRHVLFINGSSFVRQETWSHAVQINLSQRILLLKSSTITKKQSNKDRCLTCLNRKWKFIQVLAFTNLRILIYSSLWVQNNIFWIYNDDIWADFSGWVFLQVIVANRKHASTYSPVAFPSVHTGIEPPFLLKYIMRSLLAWLRGFISREYWLKEKW